MTLKTEVIALSLFSLALLSMIAVSPSYAVPEIYMTPSANPPQPGPYIGFKWNITVWVRNYDSPNVFSWQARLNYDGAAAGINATRAFVGNMWGDPLYIFCGRATTCGGIPVLSPNSVLMGDSLLGGNGETPPPNPAKLATIEFQIVRAPGKYENLTTILDIDSWDTALFDDNLNYVPATIRNGFYTWAWPVFEVPYLAVAPSLTEMNPLGAEWVVGRPFDAEIRVKNLDIGWNVVSASFSLGFNDTVIDILGGEANVTVNTGDWNGGPPSIVLSQGRVNISVTTSKTLSDVLIATIKFTVLCQQYSPPSPPDAYDWSPLDLADIVLADTVGPIPTSPEKDGLVYVYSLTEWPDVAVTNVAPCLTEAHAGWEVKINITAINYGVIGETFSVTAFYDNTPIETKIIVNLDSNASITTTFNWNTLGVPPGNHTIKVEASIIPGESYIENNILTDGIIRIKMLGDVNGDNRIDMRDVAQAAKAFGAYPRHPRWNLQADITQDNRIDIRDIALLVRNFGQIFP